MGSLLEAALILTCAGAVTTVLAWVLTDDRLFRRLLLLATLGSAWLLVEATFFSLCGLSDNPNAACTADRPRYPLVGIPILLAVAAVSKRYRRAGVLYYIAIVSFVVAAFLPYVIYRR